MFVKTMKKKKQKQKRDSAVPSFDTKFNQTTR